jgi:hypothetical protein
MELDQDVGKCDYDVFQRKDLKFIITIMFLLETALPYFEKNETVFLEAVAIFVFIDHFSPPLVILCMYYGTSHPYIESWGLGLTHVFY